MSEHTFTVYKTESCPYCQQAMQFLKAYHAQRGDFDVKLVDGNQDPKKVRAAMKRVGRSTVPQVFLDRHHIGGWDDLARWAGAGALDHYLDTGEWKPPQRRAGLFGRLFGRGRSA